MAGPASGDGKLEHLTGIRCLAALWIVCGHYMPVDPVTLFTPFTCRSFFAVDWFIVMSGFVTHWAYSVRLASGTLSISQFYVRRVAPILLTTYVAMIVSLALVFYYEAAWAPGGFQYLKCFLMVAHWVDPAGWCPAPPSWTIEALLPSWLLYPFANRIVTKLEEDRGEVGMILAILALWALCFGPVMLEFICQGFELRWTEHSMSFFFPPAQIPDFMMGVIAAALARRHADGGEALLRDETEFDRPGGAEQKRPRYAVLRPLLADLIFVVIAFAVLFLPSQHKNCQKDGSADLLLDHCFAPLIALYFYSSAVGSGGLIAQRLSYEPLVFLGNYSFEVYLFQWPVMFIIRNQCKLEINESFSPEAFFLFLIVDVLVSGLYAEWFAPPLLKRIRAAADEFGKQPEVKRESDRYAVVPSTVTPEAPGPL